jgi:hypothetical protein
MKRLLCLFFILCAAPVFAGPPISGGGGSGLFDATTGIATGNATIQKADPALILDGSTAGDTDFWMQVVADEGGDDNDTLQIGTGTTPGSNSKITVNKDGKVGINTTDFDGTPPVGTLIVKGDSADGTTLPFVIRDSDEANVFEVDSDGYVIARRVGYDNSTAYTTYNYGQLNSYAKNAFTVELLSNKSADDFVRFGTSAYYGRQLTDTDGEQTYFSIFPEINQSGTAAWNGLKIKAKITAEGDGSTGNGNNLFIAGTDVDEDLFVVKSDGKVGVNTTDFDGTPAVGQLIVKGDTNDGSTLPFVVRDSDEANVFTVDSDGAILGSVQAWIGANTNFFAGLGAGAGATANWNIGIGNQALDAGVSGDRNTAIGFSALTASAHGGDDRNTAVGAHSMQTLNGGGRENTAIGVYSGSAISTGDYNTMLGGLSGSGTITGNNNIMIGYMAGGYETGSSTLMINSLDRTDESGDRTKSIIYGVQAADVADQTLDLNANVDTTGRVSNTPVTEEFTAEADITDPLTSSVVLLDGDNDGDNDTLDLQNGTTAGQHLHLIASADIDADDTCTISYADTTCTNCAATVFDKIGENVHLIWTGSTWVQVSLTDSL